MSIDPGSTQWEWGLAYRQLSEEAKTRYDDALERLKPLIEKTKKLPLAPKLPEELHMTAAEFTKAGPKKRTKPQLEETITDLLEKVYLIQQRIEARVYFTPRLYDCDKCGLKHVDPSYPPPLSEGEIGAINDLKELITRVMRNG